MLIRVLGTIAVEDDSGNTQTVTSPRMRLVLAILASSHGSSLTASRLLDLIWPEGPPASAETSLQVTISQIRKLLEPNRQPRAKNSYLKTTATGYCLDIARNQLDLFQLQHLITAANKSSTDHALKSLHTWWDPLPFAEFNSEPWATPTVQELNEGRLRAISLHAIGAIRDARSEVVIPILTEEATRDPHEERFASLLMLALFQQGRQVDALKVYRQLQARLRDDLGLEPTERLQSLERAILQDDLGAARERIVDHPRATRETGTRPGEAELIGRSNDLNLVAELLATHSIVTIVGPAGSGKSRLAREVQRTAGGRLTHFIDLTPVSKGDHVAQTIADSVGLVGEPNLTTIDALCSTLGLQETLVILDNCEQVITGASKAAIMLGATPNVSVLTTSQVLLNLSNEQSVPLQPLALPSADASFAAIASAPACQLLAERSGIKVTRNNAEAFAAISHFLDGLPLAIELGAYRLRTTGPERLLHDLKQDLLIEGPRDLESHRRSMDVVLERSTRSLSDVSRTVLVALSVFASSVPIEAITRILSDNPSEAVARAVSELSDRNLITVRTVEPASQTGVVYGLLESVRSYVRRSLINTETTRSWQQRHVDLICDTARQARRARAAAFNNTSAGPMPPSLADLDEEIGRALDFLEATATDGPKHHELVTNIGSYWYQAGRLREAHQRMRTTLTLYPDVDPLWRGITLAAGGLMSFSSGEFRQVDTLLSEAIGVLGPMGMPGLELLHAARLVARHDLTAVEEQITTALSSNSIAGFHRAIALDIAAYSAWFGGDYPTAIERFHQQERAAIDVGDVFLEGRAIRGRGLMLTYQGSPESGALLCQRSIELIEDWDNDRSVAQCLAIRSAIHLTFGKDDEAHWDALRSMRRASSRFDGNPMMIAVPVLASIEAGRGRASVTAQLSGWIRGICDATGMYPPAESEVLLTAAELEAQKTLNEREWLDLRSSGASGGLIGLIWVVAEGSSVVR